MKYDLIIIGGGPAGMTAGIYAGRLGLKTLLITKSFGGQIAKKAVAIENYPGFESIPGIELVQKMEKHLRIQKIDIETSEVRKIEKTKHGFLVFAKKKKFQAKAVILASGADPRPLEVPGEKEFIGKGVSYCAVCLPSGEEIVTNSSLEKIGEIGIAHRVLTGNGTFQNINQIMSNNYRGKLIKIKTKFFTEPVKLTANHPVLIGEVKKLHRGGVQIANKTMWKRANELMPGDVVLYPIISKVKDVKKIRFSEILGTDVEDEKARNNQETFSSHRLDDEIPLNGEFLRLAGYYLSEGSLGRQEIRFYFCKNEEEYLEDTKKLIKTLFNLEPRLKTVGNVTSVAVSSRLIRDLFHLLFGKNAPNKKIPHWMLYLPKHKQKELIKGYYRGDGCVKYKCFEMVTVSRILAYQLRDFLLRFGVISGIDRRKKEKLNKIPGEVGGRKIRFNYDRYHIRIGGPSLKNMSEILGVRHPKINQRKWICRHAWIKGKYLYLPVREIEKEKYKGRVYNLIINKNNTFVAKNFIVHNCDGPMFRNKVVAVIGGGNAGFETAIFLAKIAKKIYILEYGSEVKAFQANQEIVKKTGKAEIITNSDLKEIKGGGFVNSIIYKDRKAKKEKTLKVEGVFVEVGYQPATSYIKGLVDFNKRDEIKVEFETCQTRTPGLFAAGDLNVGVVKQIVTAAGEGAKAAIAAYNYIQKL